MLATVKSKCLRERRAQEQTKQNCRVTTRTLQLMNLTYLISESIEEHKGRHLAEKKLTNTFKEHNIKATKVTSMSMLYTVEKKIRLSTNKNPLAMVIVQMEKTSEVDNSCRQSGNT